MTAILLHKFTKRGDRFLKVVCRRCQEHPIRWIALMLLLVGLSGCSPWFNSNLNPTESQTWAVYRNDRYGFEFLYPNDWQPEPPPTNLDGQRFTHPEAAGVEMRGWAGSALVLLPQAGPTGSRGLPENFVTDQGIVGYLQVEIGLDVSSMTLTLVRDQIAYSWQGRSPSREFADYYRLFTYIARQYRIPVGDVSLAVTKVSQH